MFKISVFFLCLTALFTLLTVLSRENMALTLAFSSMNGLICSFLIPYEYVAVGVFVSSLIGLTLVQIITEIVSKRASKRHGERT